MRLAKRGFAKGWLGALCALAVATSGLLACAPSVTNGTLGFTVVESLLILEPEDSAAGYVLLSGGIGTCPALQAGGLPDNFANLNYLVISIFSVDANQDYAALTAGTYTVYDPSSGPSSFPALFAYSGLGQNDNFCNPNGTNASSGTVAIIPFATADGGTSTLTYTDLVYGSSQLSGTATLTTCLVSATTPNYDAGVCIPCVPTGADGGVCAIQ